MTAKKAKDKRPSCDNCGAKKPIEKLFFPYDIEDKKSHIKWCEDCIEREAEKQEAIKYGR